MLPRLYCFPLASHSYLSFTIWHLDNDRHSYKLCALFESHTQISRISVSLESPNFTNGYNDMLDIEDTNSETRLTHSMIYTGCIKSNKTRNRDGEFSRGCYMKYKLCIFYESFFLI